MTTATDLTTLDWLMEGDPSIRWQVLRDLLDAPAEEVAEERSRVAREGWGARILDLQDDDGSWNGGACFTRAWREAGDWSVPQPWSSTMWALRQLVDCGIDPGDARVRDAVERVAENVKWEYAGEDYFAGEVEPCINGQTVNAGAYFGRDVDDIVERLVGETMSDGGWNCEQENGATVTSVHTTIAVLEGLLRYSRSPGADRRLAARADEVRGPAHEYLLERRLMRRRSTGEVIAPEILEFSYPPRWHYDVLRALDYFRDADLRDERLADAVELVRSKGDASGRWALEHTFPGEVLFPLEDGDGAPSRWNTLRALRVLRWWDAG